MIDLLFHCGKKFVKSFVRDGRYDENLFADCLFKLFDFRAVGEQIRFACDDKLRNGSEFFAVSCKFGVDFVVIVDGISALAAADVDDMNNEAHSFDVAKELVSEPRALACALD